MNKDVSQTVYLDLGDQSYDIRIGSGLLKENDSIRRHVSGGQAFVVSNETIAEHYLDDVLTQLSGLKVDTHLMPDGEQCKTMTTLEGIMGGLLEAGHNRTTTIIATRDKTMG